MIVKISEKQQVLGDYFSFKKLVSMLTDRIVVHTKLIRERGNEIFNKNVPKPNDNVR